LKLKIFDNMRTIKFRFWSGINYLDSNTLCVRGNGHLVDLDHSFWCDAGENGKHYVAEQYTGLKDKFDKEIYEGDFVELNEKGKKRIFRVEWCEWENTGFLPFIQLSDDYDRAGYRPEPKNMEVIGNIHENPELLEKAL